MQKRWAPWHRKLIRNVGVTCVTLSFSPDLFLRLIGSMRDIYYIGQMNWLGREPRDDRGGGGKERMTDRHARPSASR